MIEVPDDPAPWIALSAHRECIDSLIASVRKHLVDGSDRETFAAEVYAAYVLLTRRLSKETVQ